jgi:ribosome maturation factor RimP
MATDNILTALLEPVVNSMGYEWVGMIYRPSPKYGLLRIYIDKPGGVTVDDCALVSHQISGVLDVEDPVTGQYDLEISSPGVDRPLFRLADYERFSGSKVRINLHALWEGRRRFSGTLLGIDRANERVLLEEDGERLEIPYSKINQAKLEAEVELST